MKEQKGALVRQLYMPAILCTALWGSAAPCIKKGYELFEIAADASFSQLLFAGWRFALAGVLVLIVAKLKGHRILPVHLLLYRSFRDDRHEGRGAFGHADLFCPDLRAPVPQE